MSYLDIKKKLFEKFNINNVDDIELNTVMKSLDDVLIKKFPLENSEYVKKLFWYGLDGIIKSIVDDKACVVHIDNTILELDHSKSPMVRINFGEPLRFQESLEEKINEYSLVWLRWIIALNSKIFGLLDEFKRLPTSNDSLERFKEYFDSRYYYMNKDMEEELLHISESNISLIRAYFTKFNDVIEEIDKNFRDSDYDSALGHIDQLLTTGLKKSAELSLLCRKASILLRVARFDDCLALVTELRPMFEDEKNKTAVMHITDNRIRRSRKKNCTLEDFSALDCSYGTLLSIHGTVLAFLIDLEAALPVFNDALIETRRQGIKIDHALILTNIGSAYSNLNQYDLGRQYFEEAYDLTNEMGDTRTCILLIRNLIRCLHHEREFDKSLEYSKVVLKLSHDLGDARNIVSAFHILGITYQHMGDLEKTKEYFEKSLTFDQTGKTMGEGTILSLSLYKLVILNCDLEYTEQAMRYFKMLEEVCEDSSIDTQKMQYALAKAKILILMSDNRAKEILYESLNIVVIPEYKLYGYLNLVTVLLKEGAQDEIIDLIQPANDFCTKFNIYSFKIILLLLEYKFSMDEELLDQAFILTQTHQLEDLEEIVNRIKIGSEYDLVEIIGNQMRTNRLALEIVQPRS